MNALTARRPLRRVFPIAAALVSALAFAQAADASPCAGADPCPWTEISTVGDVGPGEFRAPTGVAADGNGNLYVLDQDERRVQKLDPTGGFLAEWGSEGSGEGEFSIPSDVAVDAAGGGVYVTDNNNSRLQKFDTSGNFVSAWGWGVTDGSAVFQVCTNSCRAGVRGSGPGQFNSPVGIVTDGVNVYVADAGNKRIQKFDLDGGLVGQWAVPSAQTPVRLAAAGGKIYVTTRAGVVWRFDTNGVPDSSWDGDGVAGSLGAGAGQLSDPDGVAVDGTGVYVVDNGNHRVSKFDLAGGFTTMWGWGVADGANALQTCSANCQAGTPGSEDGRLTEPYGLVATGGAVWVADTFNHRLQKFGQGGAHQLTVGTPPGAGEFYNPTDVAVSPSGDVYVSDRGSHEIERLDGSGHPIARWGTGLVFPFSVAPIANGVYAAGSDQVSLYDPVGAVLNKFGSTGSGQGQLGFPTGSTVDQDGNVYVAERSNNRVQKFDPTGAPLATFGSLGSGDGQLKGPMDVAVDSAGNVYVADAGNNRVEKFGPAGDYVSSMGSFGSGDGQFSVPNSVALDEDGHLFVSDSFHNRIQELDAAGNFVAKWGASGDGSGELSRPYGLAVDSAGALWVADSGNHRMVRFCCPSAHESSDPGGGIPPSDPPPAGGGTTDSGSTDTAGAPAAGTAADSIFPNIRVSGRSTQRTRLVRRRGLALRMATSEPATAKLRAVLSQRDARRLGLRSRFVGRLTADLTAPGSWGFHLRLTARVRRAILRTSKLKIVVRASAADPAGNRSSASLAITVAR
jgi:tripartite motif-containing protein 71